MNKASTLSEKPTKAFNLSPTAGILIIGNAVLLGVVGEVVSWNHAHASRIDQEMTQRC